MLLTLALVGGCVTANYCDIARPVRPSVEDKLTEGTKSQILAENTKVERLCGVRP